MAAGGLHGTEIYVVSFMTVSLNIYQQEVVLPLASNEDHSIVINFFYSQTCP